MAIWRAFRALLRRSARSATGWLRRAPRRAPNRRSAPNRAPNVEQTRAQGWLGRRARRPPEGLSRRGGAGDAARLSGRASPPAAPRDGGRGPPAERLGSPPDF